LNNKRKPKEKVEDDDEEEEDNEQRFGADYMFVLIKIISENNSIKILECQKGRTRTTSS